MLNKHVAILLGIACVIAVVTSPAECATSHQSVFYVSPTGSDAYRGTLANPFQTIVRARDAVRAINRRMSGDIQVILRGGIYATKNPIEFGIQDSGFNGHRVIYEAYPQEKPILSGGTLVTGWTLDHDGIYKARLVRNVKLRSLFVNGVRASMTSKQVTGLGAVGTFTVAGTEPWAETAGSGPDGILFSSSDVDVYNNPSDVELDQQYTWNASIIGVRNIVQDADGTVVQLQQPAGVITSTLNWGCGLKPTGKFTIRNAYELLKNPGDFYFDRSAQTVYYFSRGEDMSTAAVIAPSSGGLLRIDGESTAQRVQNIDFKGIDFEYDDWQLEDVAGSHFFAGVQSAALYVKYRQDGDWHRDRYNNCDVPPGAIDVRNAAGIGFEGNTFSHLSSVTAICLANDVDDSLVEGNVFSDLNGNAVIVGSPQHGYTDGSSKLFPVGVLGVCTNDVISNNVIRNVSVDYSQLEGIAAFFVDGLQIVHNDINGTPYCAIALGWGWSNQPQSTTCRNNIIGYNRVENSNHVLGGDGGCIYTIGQQPNSQIVGNYVIGGPRQIYNDEGSAYFHITDNVLERSRNIWLGQWTPTIHDNIIDNNYTTVANVKANGTNCPITNTHVETLPWSPAAQAIIDNAGLEPEYRHLLADPTTAANLSMLAAPGSAG